MVHTVLMACKNNGGNFSPFIYNRLRVDGVEKGHPGESNAVSTIFFGLLAASVDAFEVEKFLFFYHIFLRKFLIVLPELK